MASLAAGLLLAAPDARAGSFSAPIYSGGSVKPTSSGGSYILLYPFSTSNGSDSVTGNPGYGANGYASCGTNQGQSTSFTIAINSTPPLTAKLTWQPSYAGEPPPASVVVVQHCVAQWTGFQNGTGTASGSADSSLGPVTSSGPLTETCDNTKYTVETPAGDGSVTVKCTPSASLSASSGGSGGGSGGISVSYSAGIVSGGWVGPYYFHKGQYTQGVKSNPTTSPWPNNMAGDYPTGTDTYDGNHIFQLQEATVPFAESVGTIIPVWVWSGPNLPGGTAPPAFSINETTDAFAEDETNGGGTDWEVDDKQGNTPIVNTSNEQFVMDTKPNTTTVSSFTTASGSVWWALGQPFDLTAYAFGYEVYPPYNYYVYVGMSANMASQ